MEDRVNVYRRQDGSLIIQGLEGSPWPYHYVAGDPTMTAAAVQAAEAALAAVVELPAWPEAPLAELVELEPIPAEQVEGIAEQLEAIQEQLGELELEGEPLQEGEGLAGPK